MNFVALIAPFHDLPAPHLRVGDGAVLFLGGILRLLLHQFGVLEGRPHFGKGCACLLHEAFGQKVGEFFAVLRPLLEGMPMKYRPPEKCISIPEEYLHFK